MSDALETYDVVAARLREIYIEKNTAYGNSFDTTIDKFGYVAALVRMHDKMERLCSLIMSQAPEGDEPVLDTAMDLANYSIMLVSKMLRDGSQSTDTVRHYAVPRRVHTADVPIPDKCTRPDIPNCHARNGHSCMNLAPCQPLEERPRA